MSGASFTAFRNLYSTFIAGAVVFGLLSTTLHATVGSRTYGYAIEPAVELVERVVHIGSITMRARQGDQRAANELLIEYFYLNSKVEAMKRKQQHSTPLQTVAEFFKNLSYPDLMLVMLFVFSYFLSTRYYLVASVHKRTKVIDAWKDVAEHIVPLCGVALWVFVRSLVWIPLIGTLLSYYLFPRLSLASIIWLKGNRSIKESTRMSYRLSGGNWIRLFYRLVFLFILCAGSYCALSIITAPLQLLFAPLGLFMLHFIHHLVIAYAVVHFVGLAEKIV